MLCFGRYPRNDPLIAPPAAQTQAPPRSDPPRPVVRFEVPSPRKGQFVGCGFISRLGKGARCLVCGDPLVQDVIACPACATLHHQECWTWTKGCSTCGCGQASSRGSPADRP